MGACTHCLPLLNIHKSCAVKFPVFKIDSLAYVHFICLVETWLQDSDGNFFNIPGYRAIHHTRANSRGGGISVYVKNGINIINYSSIGETIQCIKLKVLYAMKYYNLVIVYNPSIQLIGDCTGILEPILNNIGNENCIIIGDFNVDISSNSVQSDTYLSFLSELGYATHNNKITRPCSGTVIDHVASNINKGTMLINTSGNDISDHNSIFVSLNCSNNVASQVNYHTVKRTDYNVLQRILRKKLSEKADFVDTEVLSQHIHESLWHALDNSISSYEVKPKYKKLNPWATKELATLTLNKQTLYKKVKAHPANVILSNQYKSICKKVNDLRRKLKSKYTNERIQNCIDKKKSIWDVLKDVASIVPKKVKTDIPKLVQDGFEYTQQGDIAEVLNDFYINIGPDLSDKMEHITFNNYNYAVNSKFVFDSVDDKEIRTIIDGLSNKASCPNGISNIVLKKTCDTVTPYITELINLSYQQGIYPSLCKVTKVKPLYKDGDATDPGNYRPLSMLSSLSRVTEKATKVRLEAYLKDINFFFKFQYGFKSDKDAQGAVFDLCTNIQASLDNNQYTCAIFIDLKKAFDTVNHEILIKKLHGIGIEGMALEWFKSYLSNRSQHVHIGDSRSSCKCIICGVPQGSILGPLLFIIYINDIGCLNLRGKLQLYADDAVLYFSSDNLELLERYITEDLLVLNYWFLENKLSLNLKKTNYVLFTKPAVTEKVLDIKIGNHAIKKLDSVKYLGVYLDKHLNFECHINKMIPSLRATIRLLYRLRHTLSVDQLKLIYFSYFHSHMSYMAAVWGHSNHLMLNKIRVMQNSAMRLILNKKYHVKDLYISCNVLPLDCIVNAQLCCIIYNHVHKKKILNCNIIANSLIHNHATRNAMNYQLPRIKSTYYGLKTPYYKSITLFNALPFAMKCTLYQSFKTNVKNLFFNSFKLS